MSTLMKFTFLGLTLSAMEAHAILPCRERLSNFQNLTGSEVQVICNHYEKSFDKMATDAGESDEKKTIDFMMKSSIRVKPKTEVSMGSFFFGGSVAHQYKTFAMEPSDALKVVRALPNEALESFPYLMKATHPEREGILDTKLDKDDVFEETMYTISKIPKEKLVTAALVAKNFQGKPDDFYKLVYMTSSDKLLSLGTLMEKMPLKQAKEMNAKFNQFEIVCGLSFPAADETNLNANVKSCNEFRNGLLCKPKAIIFELLSKNINRPDISKYFKLLHSSDAYTENQAVLIQALFNDNRFSSIMEQVFKSENITDEVVAKIVTELEKSSPSKDSISKILKSSQPSYEKLGPMDYGFSPNPYGTKEDRKCLSEEAHAAMLSDKKGHIDACLKYFADKNMIKCDVEYTVVEKIDPDDYRCAYDIKTTPYYSSPNAVSCYTQDMKSNLSALKNIANGADKRKGTEVNDSKIIKDSNTHKSPNENKNSKAAVYK